MTSNDVINRIMVVILILLGILFTLLSVALLLTGETKAGLAMCIPTFLIWFGVSQLYYD